MRILLITDAWSPQVNGVVRTLQATAAELRKCGHEVVVIEPGAFASIPCPTYPEIRLAMARRAVVGKRIAAAEPDAVHIATEGPLGVAARAWCLATGTPFTTAFHTQFPEYVAKRTGLPAAWFWRYIRWFHGPARAVLASTPTVMRQLHDHGIHHGRLWGRGVDLTCFGPDAPAHPLLHRIPRPIQLYVGRIAVEKNVQAFLDSGHTGSKVVIGDGPALAKLKRLYPRVAFMGAMTGESLASAYATADVLVFPSKTDTFGLVMIEALACGTPVAAFPVAGPRDILREDVGRMDDDIDRAIAAALACDRGACAEFATRFSWARSAAQFVDALALLPPESSKAAEAARIAA